MKFYPNCNLVNLKFHRRWCGSSVPYLHRANLTNFSHINVVDIFCLFLLSCWVPAVSFKIKVFNQIWESTAFFMFAVCYICSLLHISFCIKGNSSDEANMKVMSQSGGVNGVLNLGSAFVLVQTISLALLFYSLTLFSKKWSKIIISIMM